MATRLCIYPCNVCHYQRRIARTLTRRVGGYEDIVKLLLFHGARPEEVNEKGMPPLAIAIKTRHQGIIQLLVREGADVNQVILHGTTPLNLAKMRTSHGCTPTRDMVWFHNARLDVSMSRIQNVRRRRGQGHYSVIHVGSDRPTVQPVLRCET